MAGEKKDNSAHGFSFISIDGGVLPLSSFSGKAILVVNTASKCGFTKQYSEMQKLWLQYKKRGLIVLGIPSNDFGSQEPDDEKGIKKFCKVNFGINFPMTTKVNVKGNNAHPFYKWASDKGGSLAKPRWNFHKYLLDPTGKLVDWFSSPTSLMSHKVFKAIEAVVPLKSTHER